MRQELIPLEKQRSKEIGESSPPRVSVPQDISRNMGLKGVDEPLEQENSTEDEDLVEIDLELPPVPVSIPKPATDSNISQETSVVPSGAAAIESAAHSIPERGITNSIENFTQEPKSELPRIDEQEEDSQEWDEVEISLPGTDLAFVGDSPAQVAQSEFTFDATATDDVSEEFTDIDFTQERTEDEENEHQIEQTLFVDPAESDELPSLQEMESDEDIL